MTTTVDPAELQAGSRELRRLASDLRLAPTDVNGALLSVADHCGDGVCAQDARTVAGAWRIALAGLGQGAGSLAGGTAAASDSYATTENVVFTGMTGTAS